MHRSLRRWLCLPLLFAGASAIAQDLVECKRIEHDQLITASKETLLFLRCRARQTAYEAPRLKGVSQRVKDDLVFACLDQADAWSTSCACATATRATRWRASAAICPCRARGLTSGPAGNRSGKAPVHAHHLRIDPRPVRPGQERHRRGNVLGRAQPLQRRHFGQLRHLRFRFAVEEQFGRDGPGATALTVMPRPRSSLARTRTSPSTPALAAI